MALLSLLHRERELSFPEVKESLEWNERERKTFSVYTHRIVCVCVFHHQVNSIHAHKTHTHKQKSSESFYINQIKVRFK